MKCSFVKPISIRLWQLWIINLDMRLFFLTLSLWLDHYICDKMLIFTNRLVVLMGLKSVKFILNHCVYVIHWNWDHIPEVVKLEQSCVQLQYIFMQIILLCDLLKLVSFLAQCIACVPWHRQSEHRSAWTSAPTSLKK